MKISDVRIRFVKKDESKLKAVASITIDDCFVVHDIKVIEGDQGLFIAMPSRKAARLRSSKSTRPFVRRAESGRTSYWCKRGVRAFCMPMAWKWGVTAI